MSIEAPTGEISEVKEFIPPLTTDQARLVTESGYTGDVLNKDLQIGTEGAVYSQVLSELPKKAKDDDTPIDPELSRLTTLSAALDINHGFEGSQNYSQMLKVTPVSNHVDESLAPHKALYGEEIIAERNKHFQVQVDELNKLLAQGAEPLWLRFGLAGHITEESWLAQVVGFDFDMDAANPHPQAILIGEDGLLGTVPKEQSHHLGLYIEIKEVGES